MSESKQARSARLRRAWQEASRAVERMGDQYRALSEAVEVLRHDMLEAEAVEDRAFDAYRKEGRR